MGHEFELYKLLSDQIEHLRAAQRESRRFYTLVNITGASIVFGIQSEKEVSALASLGVVLGLLVLCTLWLNATSYYTRCIRLKSDSLLTIEAALGFAWFRNELNALHGSIRLPNSFAERVMISILIALYIGLAGFLGVQAELINAFGTLRLPSPS